MREEIFFFLPSRISIVMDRETTSRLAKSFAVGAYLQKEERGKRKKKKEDTSVSKNDDNNGNNNKKKKKKEVQRSMIDKLIIHSDWENRKE